MCQSKKEYFFVPGRKCRGNKTGGKGPTIFIVEGKYRYKYNKVLKDGNKLRMNCVEQTNPEYSCQGKALGIKKS